MVRDDIAAFNMQVTLHDVGNQTRRCQKTRNQQLAALVVLVVRYACWYKASGDFARVRGLPRDPAVARPDRDRAVHVHNSNLTAADGNLRAPVDQESFRVHR